MKKKTTWLVHLSIYNLMRERSTHSQAALVDSERTSKVIDPTTSDIKKQK